MGKLVLIILFLLGGLCDETPQDEQQEIPEDVHQDGLQEARPEHAPLHHARRRPAVIKPELPDGDYTIAELREKFRESWDYQGYLDEIRAAAEGEATDQ